jgi:GTP-binding protein HflX
VSLVGYTNAGKSTLFNVLTKSSAAARDQLFSTLDTTTRLLVLPGNQKIFLADTVGFVRELPHHLVEAFKSTLEEARQADLLLHVVDSSRPDAVRLMDAVEKVLQLLEIEEKRVLLVLNKSDLPTAGTCYSSPSLKDRAFVSISARTGQGINELCLKVAQMLAQRRGATELFVPKDSLGLTHYLYEEGEVLERRDTPQGAYFKVRLSEKEKAVFRSKLTG